MVSSLLLGRPLCKQHNIISKHTYTPGRMRKRGRSHVKGTPFLFLFTGLKSCPSHISTVTTGALKAEDRRAGRRVVGQPRQLAEVEQVCSSDMGEGGALARRTPCLQQTVRACVQGDSVAGGGEASASRGTTGWGGGGGRKHGADASAQGGSPRRCWVSSLGPGPRKGVTECKRGPSCGETAVPIPGSAVQGGSLATATRPSSQNRDWGVLTMC